jgi:hypothetical protein
MKLHFGTPLPSPMNRQVPRFPNPLGAYSAFAFAFAYVCQMGLAEGANSAEAATPTPESSAAETPATTTSQISERAQPAPAEGSAAEGSATAASAPAVAPEATPPGAPTADPGAPSEAPAEVATKPSEPGATSEPSAKRAKRKRSTSQNAPITVDKGPPPPNPNTLPFTYHAKHLDLQFGLGVAWFPSATVDPFSKQDQMTQVSLRVGAFPFKTHRWAFGFLAEGIFGGMNSNARDQQSSLELGILGLGLESRYHFDHRFFAFGRLSPGALFLQPSLKSAFATDLNGSSWGFTLGGQVGVGARIWGPDDGSVRDARGWLIVGGGYRFATQDDNLTLKAPDDASPAVEPFRPAPIDVTSPELTVALSVTY